MKRFKCNKKSQVCTHDFSQDLVLNQIMENFS